MEINNYQANFAATYKGKKILLTGHTGFKGSWLLTWLHSLGAIVKGYSLAPENNDDLYNKINGDSLCQSIIADIRDKEKIKKEIIDFEPDVVFHLAAQPLVRLSYNLPVDTFEVNVIGTANVLEALRFLRKPCVAIMITTDKVYQNKEWHYPYRETDRLGGYDPYSASKAAAELIISSYQNSFFNPDNYALHQKAIATARAGNVIGGGDWAKDRIIPDIIKALQSNTTIEVRNPLSVRPWQHVLEPIGGYLLMGQLLLSNPIKFATAYNFGPQPTDNLPVKIVVQKAIDCWGSGNWKDASDNTQPHEAHLLKLDINKTINELGWLPKYTAAQAIQKTIEWYKVIAQKNNNALDFTLSQIKEFVMGIKN